MGCCTHMHRCSCKDLQGATINNHCCHTPPGTHVVCLKCGGLREEPSEQCAAMEAMDKLLGDECN